MCGRASVLTAVFLPAVIGLGGTFVAVRLFGTYGWALFLGLPVLVSFLSALIFRKWRDAPWRACYGVSLLAILALGGFILVFAIDGLICLVMALPLASALCLVGATLGYWLGRSLAARATFLMPLLLVVVFPALLGFEYMQPPQPALHEVATRVEIEAPIHEVWNNVIAFDRIEEAPHGIFRLGIAYPVSARIDGEGVGAVRHCAFSTGPFVEPITAWDSPHSLEFSVTSNPPPMKELSPHGHLDTPHLHDTFVSTRGRFRLWEENGKVILEGTTWYFQRITPDWYWRRLTDGIIHEIHFRVLREIKRQSEGKR